MASDTASFRDTLLQFLEEHACKEFPQAFGEINDPGYYVFNKKKVEGQPEKLDLLRIGTVSPENGNSVKLKPLFAHTQGRIAEYYFCKERSSVLSIFEKKLFPDGGRKPYRHDHLPVFKYAARAGIGKVGNHREKAFRVESIVRFAFLLTGRISNFGRQNRDDVLEQLQNVCEQIQLSRETEPRSSYSVGYEAEDPILVEETSPLASNLLPMTPNSDAEAGSKRAAEMEEHTTGTASRGLTKRAKHEEVRLPWYEELFDGTCFADSVSPASVRQINQHIHGLKDAMLSICKAEARGHILQEIVSMDNEARILTEQNKELVSLHAKGVASRTEKWAGTEKEYIRKIDELEDLLVREKRKTLDETQRGNELSRMYRELLWDRKDLKKTVPTTPLSSTQQADDNDVSIHSRR